MKQLVRAIFMGENGSLGYQKGRAYTLNVSQPEGSRSVFIACAENREGECPYDSIYHFFDNWVVSNTV